MTALRVLVCGGRDFADRDRLFAVLDDLLRERVIECIIEGGCPTGADDLACWWAFKRGVNSVRYEAHWNIHGRAAGPIRNRRMLAEGSPDLVLAFPGGRGTEDMVRQAEAAGVPVVRPTPTPPPQGVPQTGGR